MGFDTQNFMINSGSFFVILLSFLIWLLLRLVLIRVGLKFHNKSFLRRLGYITHLQAKKTSIFKASFKLIVESFLDLALASFMNLAYIISIGQVSFTGADFLNSALLFATIPILLILPFSAYRIVIRSFPIPIKSKKTLKLQLFEVLTPDLKRKQLSPLLANAHFLNRRLLIVIVLMWLKYPFFQNIVFTWLSLLQICYLVTVRPFSEAANNRIEIVSEICTYLSTFLMLVFCNIGILDSAQYYLGWVYISIVSFSIMLNLGVSTMQSFKDLRRLYQEKKSLLKKNEDKSISGIISIKFKQLKFDFKMTLKEKRWLKSNKIKTNLPLRKIKKRRRRQNK